MHTSLYDEKIVQGITLSPHDDAYVPIWHTITEVSFDSQGTSQLVQHHIPNHTECA